MYVIHLRKKCSVHSPSGLLSIAVKMKAKGNFRATAMLLFYVAQQNHLTKSCTFL
jgi:hypothetical protein